MSFWKTTLQNCKNIPRTTKENHFSSLSFHTLLNYISDIAKYKCIAAKKQQGNNTEKNIQ